MGVAPRGVNIEVCSEDDIPSIVKRFNGNSTTSAMIVTKVPRYVVQLVDAGATDIKSLTVGNMGAGYDRRKIAYHVWVNDKEGADFLALHKKGIQLETRQLPDDKPKDFAELLNENL